MKNILKLLFYLFISALNYNMILKPHSIVTGGTQGIALIIFNLIKIKPSVTIFIINVSLFLLGLLFLSRKTIKSVIIATFMYPIFIRITSFGELNILNNILVLIIISGIISGITIGNILKLNYSTGGINLILLILKKQYNIEEYKSNFIINLIIIIVGMRVFGMIKCLLGIIVIIVNSLVIKIVINNVNHCQIINRLSSKP